jgi:AcrR family transcriptional regulator
MSWRKDKPGEADPPRGYHHGNLREALIRAALELIATKGTAGFTFAEAARFAGVSPAAPYRHFRDRDELMASVALAASRQFEAALSRAPGMATRGAPDAFTALDRLSEATLEFARAEPAFYSAMFEAGVPAGANPPLREAGERAFAVLRGAAEAICAAMPAAGRPPALMVALHIWTMAHGVASLFGRADGAQRALPMSAAELLEAHVLVYLRGLGVEPRSRESVGLPGARREPAEALGSRSALEVNVHYIDTRGCHAYHSYGFGVPVVVADRTAASRPLYQPRKARLLAPPILRRRRADV